MSRRKGGAREIDADVSPNLIPMIDIMFLLLLFFMLGADMGHRELEDVTLPKATSIKEDKDVKGKEHDRLTINIYHVYAKDLLCSTYAAGGTCREAGHWRIGIRGADYTEPEQLSTLLKSEADLFRTAGGAAPGAAATASDRRIMIRADALAPYGHVQDVMNLCAREGIYQIECGAARPARGARGGSRWCAWCHRPDDHLVDDLFR